MNTNHALHTGFRSLLILAALTALSAACGASPEGQGTVDEKSLTEPGDTSDPDATAPSEQQATAAPAPSLPAQYGPAPQGTRPEGPPPGGYIPTHAPGGRNPD